MSKFKSQPRKASGPVVVWKDLFTSKELDAIEAHGDGLAPMQAGVAGRTGDTGRTRITRVAWMEHNSDTQWLYARLEEAVLHLNKEFYGFDLYGLAESFQYTVYDGEEGGHYDWHVDLGGEDVEPRKISMSLQLSDSSGYQGCDLVLQAGQGPCVADRTRGTLIAFPSYVLHRVMPIESGIRKALVIWVAGPAFR